MRLYKKLFLSYGPSVTPAVLIAVYWLKRPKIDKFIELITAEDIFTHPSDNHPNNIFKITVRSDASLLANLFGLFGEHSKEYVIMSY